MQATGSKISPDVNIADESLIHNPHNDYELSVMPGADGLVFCVHDNTRNKFVALHNYSFYPSLSAGALADQCAQIIKEDELLSRTKFKSVLVGMPGKISTLIPSVLFDIHTVNLFLGFNHEADEAQLQSHDKIAMADAYNAYAYDAALADCWKPLSSKVRVVHYTTALIQSMLLQHRAEAHSKILLHVRRDSFDLVVTEGRTLQLCNVFDYKAPEDVLYHVLNAMEQLNLNPANETLIMAGQVEKKSAVYEILHKYVSNITFAQRIPNTECSYGFAALQQHKYYPIFALRQCVS